MRIKFLSWVAFALSGIAAFAQNFKGQTLVAPSLVADTGAVEPGKKFTVGFLQKIAPGWHTYWQYPGDSGLPTTIDWKLPPGFKAGAIQWPLPKKEIDPGDLWTFGYEDEVLLLAEITPPQKLEAKQIELSAKADWLVCVTKGDGQCIPGSANVSLKLPVGTSAPANTELFEKWRAQLPKTGMPPFTYKWTIQPNRALLEINGAPNRTLDFFPIPPSGAAIEHSIIGRPGDTDFTVSTTFSSGRPDQLSGVVVLGTGPSREGWLVAPAAGASPVASTKISASPAAAPLSFFTLISNLVLGFLGGFILNFMPCVLPVISLKIVGFIKQAGEEPRKIFRLGLAFVAGVFAWFLGLAALFSIFKIAGQNLNWAFQFQNSYVVIAMSAVMLVFALNLFGVFEIFIPDAAGAKMLDLSQREGYGGAFFHGVFATLLASSCTAPFLGPALGFALLQNPPVIFAMFFAIAAGMSLPYLLLTARPAWMKFLPKPGVWMERLKQFMGFLLLATVIWLLRIVAFQRGIDGLIWTSCFLLALGLACWIRGAFMSFVTSPAVHRAAWIAIVVILASSAFYFLVEKMPPVLKPAQKFSDVLQAALATKKTVFVDFTAEWCVNCKANEKLVLATVPVQDAFKRNDVIFVKADWTNRDEDITEWLRKFGKAGVPAYVVFPNGDANNPLLLPELLTQQTVIHALEQAKARAAMR